MTPLHTPSDPLDRTRFPVDPWRLVETDYSSDDLGTTETLFAVGNGYLGMRGNPPEGREAHTHGTFINGFHETWDIRHAEQAFGFAKVGQTIVNVPDSKLMKLYIDDEPLLLPVADLVSYERALDFRTGMLTRSVEVRTASGKRVQVDSTRMVSFTERHLVLMTLQVTMLEGDAPIVVSSQIINRQDGKDEYHVQSAAMGEGRDPRKAGTFSDRVLQPQSHWHSDRRMILGYRTARSRMTLAVGADHVIDTDADFEELIDSDEDRGRKIYRVNAKEGQTVTITKAVSYHTSRGVPVRELVDRCRRTLDRVREHGADFYVEQQREWMDRYWANTDVEIEGHPALQQAVRWSLFQLAQASARADQLGIAAKGVTGSGYEGHYFWDTEIYVLPFLVYTSPEVARNALRARIQMLPKARERARDLSQRGALFPWRTINGEEASAYYAAGTAQYHIDADVAYAFSKFHDVTGDVGFMARDGVDVLVETARMWADLGFWRQNGERSFHIHGVTGPDEYTTVVNNNLFTNVMARDNLARAAQAVRQLEQDEPAGHARLVRRLSLQPGEVEEWEDCAAGMTIPYDETLGIHPQDDHFLDREVWDLSRTDPAKRPLLLHYHPLVIYRFQVLKQADVVLATFLQGDRFTLEEKRRDFDYYDPITTGDSTLSAVVQAIMAAEVGYADMALKYFYNGLFVDLADLHRNTSDGVHIASAGGVWHALVYGFAGMRDYQGNLTFDPRLPADWPQLTFPIRVRGVRVRVTVRQSSISFEIEEGERVDLEVRGEPYAVTAGSPLTVPLHGQGERLKSLEGTHPVIGDVRADGTVITAGVPDPDQWQPQPMLVDDEGPRVAG
ncbi:glycoside hydrolase family 65 protein [Arsenicicoccus sp. oral taxon 190]|uniref:glycoside hydrolase family 65 protein n=1 Tax=Arsenicicoccus sp. oral taxon 190 TaxID=1658671 RepID=UPI000679ED3C|nr:glycosyl hydrolase family 65 protein [Arsenicicoccus sp. oral taxon 190]AKT50416.1 kojibiose phosphorylase [Arsenicicoccus sp. oral taxon 190]